jgi:uncharacterized membrane protein YdjX (TVP38/TMEM64 family)
MLSPEARLQAHDAAVPPSRFVALYWTGSFLFRRRLMSEEQRSFLRAALALLFIAVVAVFFLTGGDRWLSLEFIKDHRDRLLAFTEDHYFLMLLAAAAVYIAATAFSIPGGAVLSLAIGVIFGRFVGTLLTVLAATIGATLVFWAARFIFADAARARLSRYPAAARLIEGFQADAFRYLLFLRLVPLFPFWLVNLVPAFTDIKTRTYVLATLIGVIPGSFVYVNLGQALGEIGSTQDLLSGDVILGLTLLGLLAVLPALIKDEKART